MQPRLRNENIMSTNYSPEIVADDLDFCVDALATSSYGGSGTTWYNVAGSTNVTLSSSPPFSSAGYFDFDGVNDYAICNYAKHCGAARANGKVAVVRHYTRALSVAEISQNFNAQRVRFGV